MAASNTAYVGVLQGIALCEAAGVSVNDFGERLRSTMDMHIDACAWYVDRVSNNELQGTPSVASLSAAKVYLEHATHFSDEVGINSELPAFLTGLYERAEDSGLGEYNPAALVEVLRKA